MNNKETRFLELIELNKGILFKICRIYQDDTADRDDLMQEMVLQLWLAFDTFRGDSKISSWMYRVALNTAITFFKKQKRRPDSEPLPPNFQEIKDPSPENDINQQLATFHKALKQLNKVEKALIFLYMENQSSEEIAANLGITALNVRVRINRTKNKLKEIIKTMSYEY